MIQSLMPIALLILSIGIGVIGFFMKRMVNSLDLIISDIHKINIALPSLDQRVSQLEKDKKELWDKYNKLQSDYHKMQLDFAKCNAVKC